MKNSILYPFTIVSALMLSFVLMKPGYEVGDDARDFKLKNVDGKMVSMADYKEAKGIIVVFTCNTCPYSKMYEKRIIDMHNDYESQGYPVIAINSNDKSRSPGDSFDKMQVLAKKKKYPFPYLYDESQEIARAYGATNTPHVYVLQKQKDKYTVAYIGAIDNNSRSASSVTKKYVGETVDALLRGGSVITTRTKAIGCTIKWK